MHGWSRDGPLLLRAGLLPALQSGIRNITSRPARWEICQTSRWRQVDRAQRLVVSASGTLGGCSCSVRAHRMRAAPKRATVRGRILPGCVLYCLVAPQLSGVSLPGSCSRYLPSAAHINPRLASRALRCLVLRACAQQTVNLPVALPLDPVSPGASRAMLMLPTDQRQQAQDPKPPLCHCSRTAELKK